MARLTPTAPTPAVRAWRGMRIGLALVWLGFVGWLFVYAMPLSGAHGLLGAWALWPSRKGGRAHSVATVVVFVAALGSVPFVGLPEYAATTNDLHCRALGFTGARPAADCDPAVLAEGARVARDGGPLYTQRERLGVHGFNLLLAAGGALVGLPEVARETAALSFSADALPGEPTTEARRAQCRAGYTEADAARASLAPTRTEHSDFPMRSATVRRAVAEGATRLGKKPGATLDLGEVHFVHGLDNVNAYTGALLADSVRVALALEVADSRVALARREDGGLDATWTGTIHYPGEDIAFVLPMPWSTHVLRVSETVFCGMHVDGAMNPYRLTWSWALAADDPRLGPALRNEPDRGLGERLALALVAAFGVVLRGG